MTATKNLGMWHWGSRGELKYCITPGDAQTFANPTCDPSARLVDSYSSYVCDLVLFCLFDVVYVRFLPAIYNK